MKCPFCNMMPTGARGGIVGFYCGMSMAAERVQQPIPPAVIEAYRQYQPPACIRGERDRYLRLLVRAEDNWREMRAAGDALARHVAEDAREQTARLLVEAWAEVSR